MEDKKYTYKCNNGEYAKSNFEIGDVVKVTSFGQTYSIYADAFMAMNVDENYFIKNSNGQIKLKTFSDEEFIKYKNDNYVIINMCVHCRGYVLYLIKHIKTNILFVIDEDGVKLNKSIPTHITRSLRVKNETKVLTYLKK